MRSPPPPAPQSAQPQQQNYGFGGAGFVQPPFGGFINENTAQMGVQMAEKCVTYIFSYEYGRLLGQGSKNLLHSGAALCEEALGGF
jgi:hypothetical protein